MEDKGMNFYLNQTGCDSVDWCSRNQLLKFLVSNALWWVNFQMVWKILFFDYFTEKKLKFLPTFYSFDLFFTIFGPFGIIWCCRGPFWERFDWVFDLFVPIIGIMSELEYRLGFHIRRHFAWPYDRFTLTLGLNMFSDITETSCCY